jgi:hypothetical protein
MFVCVCVSNFCFWRKVCCYTVLMLNKVSHQYKSKRSKTPSELSNVKLKSLSKGSMDKNWLMASISVGKIQRRRGYETIKQEVFQLFSNKQRSKNIASKTLFTFIIYGIYWKYWFHSKIFENLFLLKSCFLPIKSHKTWKKAIKKFPSVTRRRRR